MEAFCCFILRLFYFLFIDFLRSSVILVIEQRVKAEVHRESGRREVAGFRSPYVCFGGRWTGYLPVVPEYD